MEKPVFKDLIDWHGCEAVQFNPEKLSGRATVGNTRMDADGILINYESGMSVGDLQENFGVEREAIEKILAFGLPRHLKARA